MFNRGMKELCKSNKSLDKLKLFFKLIKEDDKVIEECLEEIRTENTYNGAKYASLTFLKDSYEKDNLYKDYESLQQNTDRNFNIVKSSLFVKSIISKNKTKRKYYKELYKKPEEILRVKQNKSFKDSCKFSREILKHYSDNIDKYKVNAENNAIIEINKLRRLIETGLVEKNKVISCQSSLIFFTCGIKINCKDDADACKFFYNYFSALANMALS